MGSPAIGIDLGTTNSCAAYYANGRINILENGEGERITPSVVYFMQQNKKIIGRYAKSMSEAKPEYAVFEIKRLVGRKTDDPYIQKNLQYYPFELDLSSNDPVVLIKQENNILRQTPLEICADILTKIKWDAEKRLGESVNDAVITVPAYFNVHQREVTLAAANRAGFQVLKLLNEPTAAALSFYLDNKAEKEDYSLVYDLGGGTFDVAILKRSRNKIDIIGVDGDSHLGGQDFDNLIQDYVCDQLQREYGWNPKDDRRSMRRLHLLCEEAKRTLSITEETVIELHGFFDNDKNISIALTRTQFEELADEYFRETIRVVDNCLNSCNLAKHEISEVILSGGSTRIPKIQKMISEYFDGKILNKFVNPDECVAEGAALQAAMLSQDPRQRINDIVIKDVTPLSLGVGDFIGLMDVLIKRNTPIPVSIQKSYYTVSSEQTTLSFNVYEGERKSVEKNRYLGKLTITDVSPAPPGKCEVIFTMSIDVNGILTISANEKYNDNVKTLTVTYIRDIRSEREVKNTLKDAEDNKEEDDEFVEFAFEKEYLVNYCIRASWNFESKGLVQEYSKTYQLCNTTQNEALVLDVGDRMRLQELLGTVKDHVEYIAREHGFELMPRKRTTF